MKTILSLVFIVFACATAVAADEKIDLAGTWAFKIDPHDVGIAAKWFQSALDERIHLPGSMTTNGKGFDVDIHTPWMGSIVDSAWFTSPAMAKFRRPGNLKIPYWLQPVKYYAGAAWYQKTITVDESWKGGFIELFLERCHWETRIWVDGTEQGMRNALGAPHVYDLSNVLTTGRHVLTIRVDNRMKEINVGPNSHSVSDHTQSNWNGIVGKIELRKSPYVSIQDVRVYPNISEKRVRLQVMLRNNSGTHVQAKLRFTARLLQQGKHEKLLPRSVDVTVEKNGQFFDVEYPMGETPELWDEFNPHLYTMRVELTGTGLGDDVRDVLFGMRDVRTEGTRILVNNKPVFLRGTLECAIFPLTGFPPTDTSAWMRIFRIARAHGLNHIRFHSWCPPEAAFIAADRAGMYLQIECSSWANQGATIGDGEPLDEFVIDESERIVANYGNHPSFCLMLYGNEPKGQNHKKWLSGFITHWKSKDPRRLYTGGAGWPILSESDFNSTPDPRIQGWGQGLHSIINGAPPRTDYDWSGTIAKWSNPTISHEIGQWCVYPDFREIKQYTGVLKPKNFELFRESLEQNHMSRLAGKFLMASGKLQALCYKADIEAALRTPGFAGFQLLDLHDFPGQGTALVGVLNAFWREKGYISPSEYRKFCNSTVPLVRMPKMVYSSDDTLNVSVEIAHFGPAQLTGVVPRWKLVDAKRHIACGGTLMQTDIPIGNGLKLGEISQSLRGIPTPQKLTLVVSAGKYENTWDIWVYPSIVPDAGHNVFITQELNDTAVTILKNGGNVLLTVKPGSVLPEKGGTIEVGFSSIFWNTSWTQGQPPHTLGILCDPAHQALADFPTEYHSNWQWHDAMSHSSAIVLSDFPRELTPIVRVIDDWFTNRPLALIFEANVGRGKLLVSGIDLLSDADHRPEARQLLYSLKKYMSGNSFAPHTTVALEQLQGLFR
ncbi:MAG TPA: glycoside hydrolase family 2 TIM barrel-domain containing protein [Bacteroidota bacterium]|nr:glycoside hydrolase family 2 TIM barrel-domain containing protein [Bacteroidota bacterium]